MNLPGLNMDASKYPTCSNNSETYAIIPFSDWLPPDHEDVLCSRGGGYSEMYYSPASGMMVPSDTENGHCAFEPKDLTNWLKKLL